MKEKRCIICGAIITGQGKYFCSRACCYKYRRGRKRPEHGEKVRKALTGKKFTKDRCENISKARSQVPITEEEWDIIKEKHKEYWYVTNLDIFLSRLNLTRVFKKTLRLQIYDYLMKNKLISNGFFSIEIQKWDSIKFNNLINDIKIIPYDKILIKYNISKKMFLSFLEKNNIKNYCYIETEKRFRDTKPEMIMIDILNKYNIFYTRERYIKHQFYRVDFMVDKVIIEVQGDYWHGNSRLFEVNNLNTMQLSNIERDRKKLDYAISNGYIVIYIWELDLYKNIDKVENFIKNYFVEEVYDANKKFYSSEFF